MKVSSGLTLLGSFPYMISFLYNLCMNISCRKCNIFYVPIVGNENVKVKLATCGQKQKMVHILLIKKCWNQATVSFIFLSSNGWMISVICQKTICKIKCIYSYIATSITGIPQCKWNRLVLNCLAIWPTNPGRENLFIPKQASICIS